MFFWIRRGGLSRSYLTLNDSQNYGINNNGENILNLHELIRTTSEHKGVCDEIT